MIRSQSCGSTITKNKLRSKKASLLLTALASFVIDVAVFFIFLSCGWTLTQLPLYVFPLALVLFDVLLVLAVIKSNFRFAYSLLIPIIYSVITLSLALFTIFSINSVGQIYTDSAKFIFILVRAIISVTVILTAILGARFNKGLNFFAALSFVLCAACSVFYGGFTLSFGVFGQGSLSLRPIVYEYDQASDAFVVNGFINGNSKTAFIPKEFNGKKVIGVGVEEVFYGLDIVEIEKNEHFNLPNRSVENVEILVDKDLFENYKNTAALTVMDSDYFDGFSIYKSEAQERLNLYNAIQPKNADGVFITFKYSLDGFNYVDGKPIHAWFGDSGDTFDVNQFSSQFDYVAYSDLSNENMLYACYQDKGYMLIKPQINGEKVYESQKSILLDFEKVYAVKIGGSNDSVYQIPQQFNGVNNDAVRYVVKSTANALVSKNALPNRLGFDLSWEYSSGLSGEKIDAVDLANLLNTQDLHIHAKWELIAPTLSDISVVDQTPNTPYVYGDQITLSVEVEHPLEEQVSYAYSWDKDGEYMDNTLQYLLGGGVANPKTDSGNYTVEITVSAPSITSLSSTAQKHQSVIIGKRPIDVEWSVPTASEAVYSGTEKIFSAAVVGDLVGSDNFSYELSETGNKIVKNAGNYQVLAVIPSAYSDLYQINSWATKSFTITKKDVNVEWVNTAAAIYNGSVQHPTAYVNGVSADGIIAPSNYVSVGKNAGNYTVSAVFENANYNYNGNSCQYTINKKDVDVVWTNTAVATYNGNIQHPTATVNGVGADGIIAPTNYSGTGKNAGDYTVKANFANDNYNYNNDTKAFTIEKAAANVVWSNTELTYNGVERKPTAIANGVNGERPVIQVDGAKKNAGSGYTATATLIDQTNYYLTNQTTTFNIEKKAITISWSGLEKVYNGQIQYPTATAIGGVSGENVELELSGSGIDAGSYTITATLKDNQINSNYVLATGTANQKEFTINKKELTISWSNLNFVCDGQLHCPTAKIEVLGLTIVVSGAATEVGEYTATATLTGAAANNYSLKNPNITFNIIAPTINPSGKVD